MVLIRIKESEGHLRQCDASCYNARKMRCDCVCHGRNHGIGEKAALRNTLENARNCVDEYGASLDYQTVDSWRLKLPECVFELDIGQEQDLQLWLYGG